MNKSPSTASASNNEEQQKSDPNKYFPQTILAVSREEYYGQDTDHQPLSLTIIDAKTGQETQLPEDIQGHAFILSPAGSVASEKVNKQYQDQVVWSSKDGWTPLYNGDGMVYRLSFTDKKALLKNRLVKAPCYYADKATAAAPKKSDYGKLAFNDIGISRASLGGLGFRNQLNTAFLPFKTAKDIYERLLVTWDTGRPHEIDPETLETLQPVGTNEDWENVVPIPVPLPFKQIMTSAHPCFDPKTNEFFTLNVGKSLWTMLGLSRSLKERLFENAQALKNPAKQLFFGFNFQKILLGLYDKFLMLLKLIVRIISFIESLLQKLSKDNFVHLLFWEGKEVPIAQKWQIMLPRKFLPGKRAIKIDQTTHQMGLTEKYIIISESSFKFSFEGLLPYQRSFLANSLKILLSDFFNYDQLPYTKIYIVNREDLKKTNKNRIAKVVAKEVVLTPEFSHFVVDYDNPDNLITFHTSHLPATDIAEWLKIFDRSAFDDRDRDDIEDKYDDPDLTSRVHKLSGTIGSGLDVSRLGCFLVDGERGEIVGSQKIFKESLTWSTAFYALRDEQPTRKFTDIYWNSWGAWPDLLTQRTVEEYRNYPQEQREIDVHQVLNLTYKGIPSSLCHLKINTQTTKENPQVNLEIIDEYPFATSDSSQNGSTKHYLGTSAQFIPRSKPENPPENYNAQTDGYIVCVVLTSDKFISESPDNPNWSQTSELWIFDAADLKQGPLYKLSHPKMNFGFTVHTTWLKDAKSSDRVAYDIRKDFNEVINKQSDQVKNTMKKLFEEEVYPHFS
ncbi:lignostilbene-alpha,beta-dioxygenase-like enzyme [Xenococcus sp. PCC 7305]|uniref:carotenoid oxygenase family protein n=1 Tax=Xenococcus sp. PCC 7305 TaxID=102125 RepID=UPI0002ABEEB1|nr:carotenoid oxygenase family protein [Xenococcus sp. PCC 7305]ELS01324.1 lignostilbene-alpha,beta-dioxygenase-like enzyme [Xenococcus sp. PCC 7305]